MKFPPESGITLCEMIWDLTDNYSTSDYDGMNDIHNYQPCENIAARDAILEEMDVEPPGLFRLPY